ncbi:MAG: T9SS type A sorting domain-containing protein [Bacteroidales bacterium]
MKKIALFNLLTVFLVFTASISKGQNYSFGDFVGTWHGTISSTSSGGYNDPMTMTIESNGFYTETSGHLMPSLYPDTQECEYEASSNRMHWWYLGTVWGGQYFYDHFYYEVVYFQNDTLEMHYNYWDDPEPYPEVGTIFLVKESLTPPPTLLQTEVTNNNVSLTWNEPVLGNGGMANPTSYKVYYKMGDGAFDLLETTVSNNYTHENVTAAGSHSYYVTAVYNEGESNPSNQAEVILATPAPIDLQSQLLANNVVLNWDEPNNSEPMAGLMGFNIYHKYGDDPYDLLMFVEDNYYAHQEIPAGVHHYYVTAVYDGAESDPSNEVMVDVVISGFQDELERKTALYPNPVSDLLNVSSEFRIKSLLIFNSTGEVAYRQIVDAYSYRMNLTDLATGLYVVKIETDEGIISKRVLVK